MASEPLVLTCTFVTLGSTVGSDLRNGKPLDPKKIVGAFLAMTICSVIAEVDGEVGAGLAVAIAGTAFVKFGIPALTGDSAATKALKAKYQPSINYSGPLNISPTLKQIPVLQQKTPGATAYNPAGNLPQNIR